MRRVLADSIHEETTDYLGEPVHGDPGADARCVFRGSVPDAGECDEGWADGAFAEAEEEAGGGEAGVGFGCCEAHADAAPDDSFEEEKGRVSR